MSEFVANIPTLLTTYGLRLLGSIAVFIIGRWLVGFIIKMVKRAMANSNIDNTLASFIGNVLYYLLFALLIIITLGSLGINTNSIIAVLGGLTLALGLAMQDSLGNLAAGIMIILLRPYRLGDFVEINDETGQVTEIKIFHTQLITLYRKVIYVPNSEVIGGNIVNYSQQDLYRFDMTFGIGYSDNIGKARDILLEIMAEDDRILKDPVPEVFVGELGDSSINLVARPWIKYKDHPRVKAYVTEQVKLRFDAAGISIPFPQRDVHLFNAN